VLSPTVDFFPAWRGLADLLGATHSALLARQLRERVTRAFFSQTKLLDGIAVKHPTHGDVDDSMA
jgi:hypothetical protein